MKGNSDLILPMVLSKLFTEFFTSEKISGFILVVPEIE